MDIIIPGHILDGILWLFLILGGLISVFVIVAVLMLLFAKPINQKIERHYP